MDFLKEILLLTLRRKETEVVNVVQNFKFVEYEKLYIIFLIYTCKFLSAVQILSILPIEIPNSPFIAIMLSTLGGTRRDFSDISAAPSMSFFLNTSCKCDIFSFCIHSSNSNSLQSVTFADIGGACGLIAVFAGSVAPFPRVPTPSEHLADKIWLHCLPFSSNSNLVSHCSSFVNS